MSLTFKRLLLVTHNVQFAIDTQRALESLGDYEVTAVTDTSNAIDRLKKQPHHIAILDIESLDMPPTDMVQLVRSVQKEIAIVLAPELADVRDLAVTLNVQGVVDIPIPVRMLIPVIEQAANDVYDNLPETAKAPAIELQQETVYIETLVDELLGDDETPYFTSRQIRAQSRNLFQDDVDKKPEESNTLEVVIESKPDGDTTARVKQPKNPDNSSRSMSLFQKLASEEPPMPGFGEHGTISDLARSVSQAQLDENETEAQPLEDAYLSSDEDDGGDSAPAILILQTALDQTTPVEAISLKTLYENIQDRLPTDQQNIRPLPSWLKEGEKFVREPIFLPDSLPPLETMRPMEYTSTLTQPSESAVVISNTGDLDTEVIDDDVPPIEDDADMVEVIDDLADVDEEQYQADSDSSLEVEPAEVSSDDDIDDDSDGESEDNIGVTEHESAVVESGDGAVQTQDEADSDEAAQSAQDDPYLTQLAVTLTQMTTELTAEATVLTRDNLIVAYSGDMPVEDIDDLGDIINNDWEATTDNARIRFVTLPSSGSDYMLYSKATVRNFTLSMIFAGTKQLRVIRRQGERLLGALEEVPEGNDVAEEVTSIEPEVVDDSPLIEEEQSESNVVTESDAIVDTPDVLDVEPVDVGPKQPYTFIWLVESFEVQLSEHVAQQLVFWLQVQLNNLHWTTHKLEVHQDFVYLQADVPGEFSPSVLIRSLMERSAKIAQSEDDNLPDDLWADAYLVLTPGRDMTDREIQRFLNFARGEF